MEVVNQLIGFISKLFDWWFTVMPWQQAVFVRRGKNVKILSQGLYFKIPFIDRVYVQEIRLRMIDMPMQTVSTSDNKTISIKAVIGYSIKDLYKMFNSVSHPEITLSGIVMSGISEYINKTDSKQISPKSLEAALIDSLSKDDFGLGDLSVKIVSWADVKTFRLIQDTSWMQESLKMNFIGEKV